MGNGRITMKMGIGGMTGNKYGHWLTFFPEQKGFRMFIQNSIWGRDVFPSVRIHEIQDRDHPPFELDTGIALIQYSYAFFPPSDEDTRPFGKNIIADVSLAKNNEFDINSRQPEPINIPDLILLLTGNNTSNKCTPQDEQKCFACHNFFAI